MTNHQPCKWTFSFAIGRMQCKSIVRNSNPSFVYIACVVNVNSVIRKVAKSEDIFSEQLLLKLLVTRKVATCCSQILHYFKALALSCVSICDFTWESVGIKIYALHNAGIWIQDLNYVNNECNLCKCIHKMWKYDMHIINTSYLIIHTKSRTFISISNK